MNERKLLGSCVQSRAAYDQIAPFVNIDKDFGPEAGLVYEEIKAYYEADSQANVVDEDILAARVERRTNKPKLAAVLETLVRGLPEVSAPNVVAELIALRQINVGMELSSLLIEGKKTTKIQELIGEYQDLATRTELGEEDEDEFTGIEVSTLVKEHYDNSKLIKLLPKSLNDQIDGGCRPGHHIVVLAPTEMGKTLFVINLVHGFLKQGLKVLYVGNEDPAPDLAMRCITRITGLNKYQVRERPEEAQAILDKSGWKNLTFAPLAPGTFARIHKLMEKYIPNVVVIDQLRNIDVGIGERTQSLEKAATEARNTAKRFGVVVVSITQAADSASGKTVLGRGDIDGSNVGIPGTADLMVGIGATEEMERNNQRTLSFPKNKLSGNHSPISVHIDPLLSKVI